MLCHDVFVCMADSVSTTVVVNPCPVVGMTQTESENFLESPSGESELTEAAESSVCALELKLHQLSVYASQQRLCITAALASAFREVEEGLLMLARPKPKSITAEMAPAQKVLTASNWL